tara:strand:- start:805 stop:1044 length:240 start_codon:yes stop_codon:yes gene_type:complete
MGNSLSKYKTYNNEYRDELLPVKVNEINIGNNYYEKEYVRFLVGDCPDGYMLADSEDLLNSTDPEFNNVLADAYLYGVI